MCIVVKTNHVKEVLHLSDGRYLTYAQVEGAFSNPNGHVNEKALDWICSVVNQSTIELSSDTVSLSGGKYPLGPNVDLLELYCGNGNHTVAIAGEVILSSCPFYNFDISLELCVTMIFLLSSLKNLQDLCCISCICYFIELLFLVFFLFCYDQYLTSSSIYFFQRSICEKSSGR